MKVSEEEGNESQIGDLKPVRQVKGKKSRKAGSTLSSYVNLNLPIPMLHIIHPTLL